MRCHWSWLPSINCHWRSDWCDWRWLCGLFLLNRHYCPNLTAWCTSQVVWCLRVVWVWCLTMKWAYSQPNLACHRTLSSSERLAMSFLRIWASKRSLRFRSAQIVDDLILFWQDHRLERQLTLLDRSRIVQCSSDCQTKSSATRWQVLLFQPDYWHFWQRQLHHSVNWVQS